MRPNSSSNSRSSNDNSNSNKPPEPCRPRTWIHPTRPSKRSRSVLSLRLPSLTGLFFAATDRSAAFLDVLDAPYVIVLRARALWVVAQFGQLDEAAISTLVAERIGEWGAEFTMQSVLLEDDVT